MIHLHASMAALLKVFLEIRYSPKAIMGLKHFSQDRMGFPDYWYKKHCPIREILVTAMGLQMLSGTKVTTRE
jgi:hypothetical protein